MIGPVRHIVMWRVRGDTLEERFATRRKVKAAFEGLKGRVPGLTQIEVGLDVSGVDYACDVVLVSEFSSRAALDAYATHPEHLKVREELANLRVARFQVDYFADDLADAPVNGLADDNPAARTDAAARAELLPGE